MVRYTHQWNKLCKKEGQANNNKKVENKCRTEKQWAKNHNYRYTPKPAKE